MSFSQDEALVLESIQQGIPMAKRPFKMIGTEVGLDEKTVIQIISGLKKRRIIRNISGIFNPRRLGYEMGLVGMKVPMERIEQAAFVINAHPGVSHNYLRNHSCNMWFTLAEESDGQFVQTVDVLTYEAGAVETVVLKSGRVFKIGVNLPIVETQSRRPMQVLKKGANVTGITTLTREEKRAICLLQRDLPIVTRPFFGLIDINDPSIEEERLIEIGVSLQARWIMRRYAAVLRHVNAGYPENAMTVWKLGPDDATPDMLDIFKKEQLVTHLYLRTCVRGVWGYPLFAMIHAREEKQLNEVIGRLYRASGRVDYRVLKTIRELKKERVVYFSDAFGHWHNKQGLAN